MQTLDAALAYARRGWGVFPVRGKIPLTRNGFKDATTDETTIRRWWSGSHAAGVAIATGAASGVIVLDVDPRHGGDESLADAEAMYGPLPRTPQVLTGGGGTHFDFAHPGGVVKCRSGLGGLRGLDLKADGGYVVAPPSRHPSGDCYAWCAVLGIDEVPIAPAPQWILELAAGSPDPERIAYAEPVWVQTPPPDVESEIAEAIAYSDRSFKRFHRSREGLRGTQRGITESEVDYSLACMLAYRGLDGPAIEYAVRASWDVAGLPAKPPRYLKLTIEKALGAVAQLRESAA